MTEEARDRGSGDRRGVSAPPRPRCSRDIADLSDDIARRPSRLPGWTVGPRADPHRPQRRQPGVAVGGRCVGASCATSIQAGWSSAADDIEAGAGRPAAELVRDVRGAADAVDRVMADLSPAAWDAPSRTSRGVVEDSRDAVLSRWREVVVHHGDLGLGPVPFPPALVEVWLPRELPRLAERSDPAALLAWVIGRGEPPVLSSLVIRWRRTRCPTGRRPRSRTPSGTRCS